MHAKIVYYVYIGKSRDFTRILYKTIQPYVTSEQIYACIGIQDLVYR